MSAMKTRKRKLYKPRPEGTLKDAYAQLVDANGGTVRAADLLVSSQSQVQRCTDPASKDSELKPSQIRTLERACGQPIVTEFMAMEAHCALVPLDIDGQEPLDVDLARYGQESVQLFATYAEIKADGKVTPREAGRMKEQARRVMSRLAAMHRDLDEMMKE